MLARALRALQLEELQSRLLDVGSAVATPIPSSSEAKLQRVAFNEAHTAALEGWIDEMDAELPPLTQFILPSGALGAAWYLCWACGGRYLGAPRGSGLQRVAH